MGEVQSLNLILLGLFLGWVFIWWRIYEEVKNGNNVSVAILLIGMGLYGAGWTVFGLVKYFTMTYGGVEL